MPSRFSVRIIAAFPALGLVLFSPWLGSFGAAEEFPPSQIEFFEAKIRPLLAEHCYECHSGRSKTLQGGLRLDRRASLLEGGDSGAAVDPGKPDTSLLMQAVRWETYEMPPGGKLSDAEVAALAKWVEAGVPWTAERAPTDRAQPEPPDGEELREAHWAFQPPGRPSLPATKDQAWPRSHLDSFVLSRLEEVGLSPAPPADTATLIRRMYFDLLGLPPKPDELALWRDRLTAADEGLQDLIEHLLASPHYGERWARYWLDVARYSDGHGGFLDNSALPQAWQFRDWVVEALNHDLPIDQFLRQQMAGDLIQREPVAVATGFFALGPTYKSDGGDPDSVAQAKAETLADRVDTLGRGILGLTLACARCHDHKFDPIPQEEYYALAGVFNNTQVTETPLVPPEVVESYNDHQQKIKQLEGELRALREEIKKEGREATEEEQHRLSEQTERLDELKTSAPLKFEFAHTLKDTGSADMPVAIRGDLRKPGRTATRRFLRVLAGENPPPFTEGSGRKELAEAIVDPQNPLTARVFVNRVWMHHFGQGLVRTPSNFGVLGEPPTHPELLDWLANEFIQSGWSLKHLHRAILLSSTYQMSSRFEPGCFAADGDNRLIWRANPRRLDAEAWRDALLAVTGELDLALGGPPADRPETPRRTLYLKVSRNGDQFASDDFLRLFDFPLMRASVAQRPTSIVPQQYLFRLNSPFMIQRALALAQRLQDDAPTDEQRIELAYRLLYSRPPSAAEIDLGLQFLVADASKAALPQWQQYAQVLLSANEFSYIR